MPGLNDIIAVSGAALEQAKADGAASRQPEVDALNASLTQLQAEFDAYKQSHPDPDPPVIVGMNFKHTSTQQLGEDRAKAARIYVPAGCTDINTLTEFRRAYALGVRVFVVSWKDTSTSTVGPMLDSFPADCTRYGVAHHEPEDDMDPADWRALQAAHMPVVRAHGAIPTVILMAWTLDPASRRNPADWALPAGLVDVYGFDLYPKNESGQAASLARIKAALPSFGVDRWLLGEYGVVAADADAVARVTALREATPDAELVLYWSSQVSSTKPDYRFSQKTADAWFA